MEEKIRHIRNLYSVFELPWTGDRFIDQNEPARVMMIYDRASNLRKYRVLNRGFTAETKKAIAAWLHRNSHICDDIHGIV